LTIAAAPVVRRDGKEVRGTVIALFASDLHGRAARYEALFDRIGADPPNGVFLGGDLFPGLGLRPPDETGEFLADVLVDGFTRLRGRRRRAAAAFGGGPARSRRRRRPSS